MLSIFPIVDVDAFQKIKPPKNLLYIIKEGQGICARGYEIQDKFTILQGSTAELFGSGLPKSLKKLKKKLVKDGTLRAEDNHMVFLKDYTFRTPARAASLILGQPGVRSLWKYKNGMNLCDHAAKVFDDVSIEPETPLQVNEIK